MDGKNSENTTRIAPVVSVLGHVDHGKTSLLDKIRSTSVAAREHGGITQKIGTSDVEITHEGEKRKITFIDTPGHEAFANMRSQGVSAADIVLLIIASDDGIKPQTKESIVKILEAKIPYIVVFTKTDAPGSNVEKIKQQLSTEGILLEGLGGDVPYIGVSSKTGENIKELLDLIVLVYDLGQNKKSLTSSFLGVVIDAKLDKRRGIVATLIVKDGKISQGAKLFAHGVEVGKVRALVDSFGKNVAEALAGDGVEVLGLSSVLPAGSVLFDHEVEPEVKPEAQVAAPAAYDLASFFAEDKKDFVPIVLKTQTSAEIEAVKNALPEKIKVIYEGQGEIGVADILMAKDLKALVIGFNVEATKQAQSLAESDKIFYKSYNIIYQLLEELDTLILAINQQDTPREIGKGQILASFLGSTGVIIGTKIVSGRLAVNDRVSLFRGEKELGKAKIVSVKRGKDDIKVADNGIECGIMIEPEVDFAVGDAIIAYSKSS